MLRTRTTLPSRLGAAVLTISVSTTFVVSGMVTFASPAGARPTAAALQAQRLALIERIAGASDAVANAELHVAAAQRKQAAVAARFETARRQFAQWAVDAYVEGNDDPVEQQLRQKGWVEVVAATDKALLEQVRTAKDEADAVIADAEAAVEDARGSRESLDALRTKLEHTIADRAAAAQDDLGALPAPDGPDEVRPGTRFTTRTQAEMMARYPFGPLTAFPAGLVPTGTMVEGPASWYGPGFDGRTTASGAVFDQEGWTVASRTLPLGTMLVITRGDRSALVLVNDRGPYVTGRVLDLSKGVARHLDTIHAGVADVRAEVVVPVGT